MRRGGGPQGPTAQGASVVDSGVWGSDVSLRLSASTYRGSDIGSEGGSRPNLIFSESVSDISDRG